MRALRLGVIGTLVAAVGVAGCGGGGNASSTASGSPGKKAGPFQIAAVVATTGPTKAYGVQDYNSLRAAVDYVNAHGGFGGRPGKVALVNSNGDPSTAVSGLLRYLTSKPKPDFVFAGTTGTEVAALLPVTQKQGLLAASVSDGNSACQKASATACPTYFTVAAPQEVQQAAAAKSLQDKGYKHVGILRGTDPFFDAETTGLKSLLDKVGIKSTIVDYSSTAVDLTPQVQKLKAANVDAVYAAALGASAGYVATARAKLGWNVPLLYDLAAGSLDITKLAPPAQLKNATELVFRPNVAGAKLPGLSLLVKGAAKYDGGVGGPIPIAVAAFAWDEMLTLKSAMASGKANDAKAIMAAIEATPTTDPNLLLSAKVAFSQDVHENLGTTVDDFAAVPVGPIVDGQVQKPTS